MRAHFYTTATAAALAFASLMIPPAKAEARNILIFMLDDLAVDKVRSYAADYPGYAPAWLPDTRTMDSLAARGIRFTRAWGTPLCTPSRVSLQTGLYPYRHGEGTALAHNQPGLNPDDFLMMAEFFTNHGYKTGFFGKWHLGTEDDQGNVGTPDPVTESPFYDVPHPARSGWRRFYGLYDGYPGAGRSYTDWARVSWLGGSQIGYSADETGDMTNLTSATAVSWINQQTEDPWLAVVAFNAPHSADGASSPWQYGDADTSRYYSPALSCLAATNCGDEALAVYQGMVEHMDQEMNDVLMGIDAEMLKDTLIIVVGDNGTPSAVQESIFDVGRGKGTTYENGVRIPLIVADGDTWLTGLPGAIATPGRIAEPAVGVQDIFQTISLHALNIGIIGLDSSSFTACFSNTDTFCGWDSRRYGYTEEFVAGASIQSAEIAVRYGHDKMVATYDTVNDCLEETFYDTSTDPMELVPQTTWSASRQNRLRDHFVNLHTPYPSSWAFANGPLVPFCP